MHTSGPGAAPSLPHRYTSVPLPHAALPSAPSHALPFNIPLLRLHQEEEVEERRTKTRRGAHAGGQAGARANCRRKRFSAAVVSNVLPVFSRVLGRKSQIPRSTLARLAPTEPVEHHRGKSERRRRWRGSVGEHQRNGEAETEGIEGVEG